MATYKEIKGVTIQTLSEDPVVGGVAGGTWSSGGNLNEGRTRSAASGTQTATIFGGGTPPTTADVESYNGSSWTEIAEMNTARAELCATGAAPYTATIFFSGHTGTYPTQNPSTANEYWNGSSWTEIAEVNAARRAGGGAGTAYTAGLFFGGYTGSTLVTSTESWNGSAWTEVNEMNTARYFLGGAGSSTSAIAVNGEASPGVSNKTEEWDGTNWTEVANSPTSINYANATGSANSDILSMFGPSTGTGTFHWDGASWTEVAEYATGRGGGTATGSSSAALLSGGNPAPVNASTEEWAIAPVTAAILTEGSIFLSGGTTLKGFGKAAGIPSGVWASGGNLNQAKYANVTMGSNTEAVTYGGYKESPNAILDQTENYNGTSWTEVNEMNTGRFNHAGAGVYSSAIAFGGEKSGPANATETELWDGTSWTEVNELNTARRVTGGSGDSSTSALCFGGYPNPSGALTELWDGTSWTEVNDLNTSRYQVMGVGTSTNALGVGGNPARAINEKWDGTSWTEVGDLNTGRQAGISGGTIGIALIAGGSPNKTETESWNGTSWTEQNDISTGRGQIIGGGVSPAVAAIMAGGEPPAPSIGASTEEWTVDATLSDVTVS